MWGCSGAFNGAQLQLITYYGPNILSLTSSGKNMVLTYVGGQLLEANLEEFTRLGHLTPLSLIGGDAALDILTWKRPERVLELASFIVATRPGYDLSRLSESLEQIELRSPASGAADRVKVMEIPGLAISSSMIRQRLAEGKPVRYLVPDLVAELIEKSGFYV